MAAASARVSKIIDGLTGRRWTSADATQVLAAWRKSGLSARSFARAHGIDAQRLWWWSKRIDSESKPVHSRRTQALARLVPAVVSSAPTTASVVVHVASGLVIEVDSAAVSPAWLASLLGELSRR
jgi:hypothetical protein